MIITSFAFSNHFCGLRDLVIELGSTICEISTLHSVLLPWPCILVLFLRRDIFFKISMRFIPRGPLVTVELNPVFHIFKIFFLILIFIISSILCFSTILYDLSMNTLYFFCACYSTMWMKNSYLVAITSYFSFYFHLVHIPLFLTLLSLFSLFFI